MEPKLMRTLLSVVFFASITLVFYTDIYVISTANCRCAGKCRYFFTTVMKKTDVTDLLYVIERHEWAKKSKIRRASQNGHCECVLTLSLKSLIF